MNVYVSTCDKYDHLLNGFSYLFNKYWGADQPVKILCYRKPPMELPPNFEIIILETPESKPWSTNMRTFFSQCTDEYFVFCFDDYFLKRPVNREKVKQLELEVLCGAAKGDLSHNTNHFPHSVRHDGLVEATQDAPYRSSTQPAIWNRRHWLKLMEPGWNPWQFELTSRAGNDGARIIGFTEPVYDYANVFYKGGWDSYQSCRLQDDDIRVLTDRGALQPDITADALIHLRK